MIEQKVYQPDTVFGNDHPFRKFETYIFVTDAFTYDKRRLDLEDVFCFFG